MYLDTQVAELRKKRGIGRQRKRPGQGNSPLHRAVECGESTALAQPDIEDIASRKHSDIELDNRVSRQILRHHNIPSYLVKDSRLIFVNLLCQTRLRRRLGLKPVAMFLFAPKLLHFCCNSRLLFLLLPFLLFFFLPFFLFLLLLFPFLFSLFFFSAFLFFPLLLGFFFPLLLGFFCPFLLLLFLLFPPLFGFFLPFFCPLLLCLLLLQFFFLTFFFL